MSRLFEALSGLKTEHRTLETCSSERGSSVRRCSVTTQARSETGTSLTESGSADGRSTRTEFM